MKESLKKKILFNASCNNIYVSKDDLKTKKGRKQAIKFIGEFIIEGIEDEENCLIVSDDEDDGETLGAGSHRIDRKRFVCTLKLF